MPRKIEISHRTIIFAVIFLISLWFLYFIKDILLELFLALFIMTILNPMVTKLSGWKVPRVLSVFISYLLVFGVFGAAIAGIIPALVEQTTSFANNLPDFMNKIGIGGLINDQVIGQLLSQLGSLPGQVVKVGFNIFSNVLGVLTVLVFAFYLLLSRQKLSDQLGSFFGEEKAKKIGSTLDLIEKRLGSWARGELTLMVVVGLANFIGLTLLGIPYALPLALLAGLFEIIPTMGPIIAAIPAVLIGLSISPIMALAVAALAFLIQQLENYILVPKIMGRSVGISPIIILLALAIGFRLIGVIGALISVPVVLVLQVLSREYFVKE
jgi:predicted PurR-regulated permease PerM